MIQRGLLDRFNVTIFAHSGFLSIVLFYGIVLGFPCLLAQFRLGKGFWRALKLSLALWAAQKIVHTFVFDGDVGFAAIDAFAADGVFESHDETPCL
jgi:hypothetical protein